ncbi:ribosomal-processing cysteine protease Prp [Priestia endophytica]|jgi:uncharacterized protein YsxB (DUF464 family)|uniref:Ribosomal processing cysteine protease Prp n=2 Tax=Priestia endophytica TaxID=135735 RepID=A0AAX1QAB8_9BACI|nr:ribosomal-processing cysteine protease Prp [Priestia endophytica]KAB2495642.1 ribosomal-processing cysteine protease Prp [Priestia endophytica]KYG36211.1 hypothetical protein AZF06_03165 [Priestia endophytica]MBG9815149.1 hypothetical protein [Priestia endophytica]MCM3539756.1 ribosomal-processing cysteine protease Prp [Priestia endophytica]RAS77818.1 hypothetical protein A3864_10955 [Priestia endophytica]
MVKVVLSRNEAGHITSFEISGHADFAEHGKDLVCAAVTAVSFGTVNAIISLCDTMPGLEQGEDGGYFNCLIPEDLEEDVARNVQLLLEGMVVSLETIERDYGQYINIVSQ